MSPREQLTSVIRMLEPVQEASIAQKTATERRRMRDSQEGIGRAAVLCESVRAAEQGLAYSHTTDRLLRRQLDSSSSKQHPR